MFYCKTNPYGNDSPGGETSWYLLYSYASIDTKWIPERPLEQCNLKAEMFKADRNTLNVLNLSGNNSFVITWDRNSVTIEMSGSIFSVSGDAEVASFCQVMTTLAGINL